MLTVFRVLPLPALVAGLYVILAFIRPASLAAPMFSIGLPSGASLPISLADLLVLVCLFTLYFEVLKATRTGRGSVIDHIFSLIGFVACLLVLILVPRAGTFAFVAMTAMALIDVIAGFTITISAARRDVEWERPQ